MQYQSILQYEQKIKEHIFALLPDQSKIKLDDFPHLEPLPEGSKLVGDLTFGCFKLLRAAPGKKPPQLAQLLAESLTPEKTDNLVQSAAAAGPFVNLKLNSHHFASAVIGDSLCEQEKPESKGKVIVEFSSPNTNKPQHLGHLRNNFLGDSTANILKHFNWDVTKINLINDRGIHICKSMYSYTKWGENETPESSNIKGDLLVGNYYVKFEQKFVEEYKEWVNSEEAKQKFEQWKESTTGKKALQKNLQAKTKAEKLKDEKKKEEAISAIPDDWSTFVSSYKEPYFNECSIIGKEVNEMLVKWEANDKEIRDLWKKMNSWVFAGFKSTYDSLGIQFDEMNYESETYLLGKDCVQQGVEKGVFYKTEDGRIVADLVPLLKKKDAGEKTLLRANGTSIYMTQDLGTATMRYEKFKADKMIYVVASEQDYHFQVLFKLLEALNPEAKLHCHHLSYGMVDLPSGRMKSREGTVVDADDLLQSIKDEAKKITAKKWPELSQEELETRSEKIALAALKYQILLPGPKSKIVFDPEASLQWNGKTGGYLLYTYARIQSVFAKMELDPNNIVFEAEFLGKLSFKEEIDILIYLWQFPDLLKQAEQTYDPSKIAMAIYSVAKAFNAFYKEHSIANCEDEELKKARLMVAKVVGTSLKTGLNLLGIETLEKM